MKKICVVTATRAEYGLLRPLIRKIMTEQDLKLQLAVTGTHLSAEYGCTLKEIETDSFPVDIQIPILSGDDSPKGISETMSMALTGFAHYFAENRPDLLVVLGDRYEILAICCAALNERIPIAHIHGGETTEGAIDEACRHSITKMSQLHFTSCEKYRQRVIQLGENPQRVFNVGSIGIESIKSTKLLPKDMLEKAIQFTLDKPFAVVTFHPVTLENDVHSQMCELLTALDHFRDMKLIITKSNADAGSKTVNRMFDDYASQKDHILCVTSMGQINFYSALQYASMLIGNSSSGILEAPVFGIPSVNIGDRQKGRIQAESILNCQSVAVDIIHAIQTALTTDFQEMAHRCISPYGNGEAVSEKIVTTIKKYFESSPDLKKKFYDIE